jgi:hypothetical protein
LGQATNTLSGLNAALADITGTNPANNSYFGPGTGRANVPKVIVVVTDGVSNAPCDCIVTRNGVESNRFANNGQQMTCSGMYGQNNNYATKCQSPTRYPGLTCSDCRSNSVACFPCAEPIKLTEQINSWNTTATGSSPPSAYVTKGFLNWKVVVLGVGDLLNNPFGKSQISGMHYDHDPEKIIMVRWQNLQNAVSAVVDASCNT